MSKMREVFISVDIETVGPIVGEHSMVSLGACLAYAPDVDFSIMLQPISDRAVEEAVAVSGISLAQAEREGVSPPVAMAQFDAWIAEQLSPGFIPVFVGLNAPFDWGFVNYYFLNYLNRNPFGFTALDIKALFMGVTGCSWRDTRSSSIAKRVKPLLHGNHNALRDAKYQAELFRLVYELSQQK